MGCHPSRRVTAIGLLVILAIATGAAATREDRLAELRKGVQASIAAFEQESAKPDARFEARQFTLYAHYVLALNVDGAPAKAAAALKRAMALQEMKADAKNYGEFAASEGSTESGTATEFTVLPIAQVLMRYADKLPDDLREQLAERLKAALAVIRRRNIPADAGNVFLINAVDELLLAEIVRDDRAMIEASSRLTNFVSIARSRGINEYVAPNYTCTQLSVLLVGHNYTTQPEPKRLLEASAKFLWSQVAANVVPRRGLLGGPHSRDLDFVHGVGTIDAFLFLEGLRETPPMLMPFSDGMRAYLNEIERGYRPDESILKLAELPEAGGERLVRMRWGTQAGTDRYFYLTPDFAMGSSSATSAPYDKKLTVEFPTPRRMPTIWVVPDPFDAPYGRVQQRGRPAPPIHLREQLAAVQDKGTMLALMNLRGELKNVQQLPPTVGTNIIVPLGAEQVLLDGKTVVPNGEKPFELPASLNSVVIVREGTGAVALRLFAADGIVGQKPVVQFKYDGNPFGAARLVAYHYRGGASGPGAPKVRLPDDQQVRVGVMYLGARCASPEALAALINRVAEVKIEQTDDGRTWRGKLTDGQTVLEAALDLERGNILSRKVNGEDYQFPVFKVDDRDLAAEYLSGW